MLSSVICESSYVGNQSGSATDYISEVEMSWWVRGVTIHFEVAHHMPLAAVDSRNSVGSPGGPAPGIQSTSAPRPGGEIFFVLRVFEQWRPREPWGAKLISIVAKRNAQDLVDVLF